MASATGMSGLAGALWLRPGAPLEHALRSTRRDLAGQISRGQPARRMPDLLSTLFSLCGSAHRMCSLLAISAAGPGAETFTESLPKSLRRETATEHVRRIGLDWPRQLATPAFAAAHRDEITHQLQTCPLITESGSGEDLWSGVRQWLERHWLGMPPAIWLEAWEARGSAWLADWSGTSGDWLASLVHENRGFDSAIPWLECQSLVPHAYPTGMSALAQELGRHQGFVLLPEWQGRPAHTGTWNRLRTRAPLPDGAWGLLGSRLAELARLSLDEGDGMGTGCLGWGQQSLGNGEGLGWVEMARGLLVHRVNLDDSDTVNDYRVLAPTEWNFHPHGIAAQAVSALPLDDAHVARRVTLIMSALDPCVPYQTEMTVKETQHA